MKLVIDIDRVHLDIIKKKVEKGNTQFYPFLIIAKGKPLENVLYEYSWEQHKQNIEQQPPVKPQKTGHWILHPKGIYAHLLCDKCLSNAPYDCHTNYCPNCGSRME